MGFHIIDPAGVIVGYVDTEEEALELLDTIPEDIYTFFVGGLPEDVGAFMLKLNMPQDNGPSFFERMAEKFGRVPATLNAFREIKDEYLKNNTYFIKLRYDMLDPRLAGQMLSVLQRTTPAGGAFFVLIERRPVEEEHDLGGSTTEDVDVFYSLDVTEGHAGISETVFKSAV